MVFDPKRPADGKQMRKLFQWYWDTLLPKCAGCHYWGHNTRLSATISKARAPGTGEKKGRKQITPSTEGYIFLTWENSQPKWEHERQMINAGKTIDKAAKKDKSYVEATYSTSKAGNIKYGGWSPEGRTRFIKIMAEITEAKKKPHVKKVEECCLTALRL